MFGRWLKGTENRDHRETALEIERVVRAELRTEDEATVAVVSAIVGLLGTVAYADRLYSAAEEQRVLEELRRIEGLTEAGAQAVAHTLRKHIVEVATVQAPRYARILVELADRELRCQVLGVLVSVAAADEVISTAETNALRQLTTSLGLAQADYNELQAEYRTRLAVLKDG
ncbi:MAG: TerB family tellurite resistance protein [Polyangiaceae bacterium]|nr:TerB family tellurite resistance protein [Polyangiaceae bacterium]